MPTTSLFEIKIFCNIIILDYFSVLTLLLIDVTMYSWLIEALHFINMYIYLCVCVCV